MTDSAAGQAPVQAAFFDLDKTLIAGSSTLALGMPLYRCGMVTRKLLLRAAYARGIYQFGGADHDKMERMRSELTNLVRGWDAAALVRVIEEAAPAAIGRLIYPEAVRLIEEHKAAGQDVWLVSSAGADIVRPVGALLGVSNVIATRMVVDEGLYTGEIEFYAYAEHKATAIRELAAERGYDLDQCSAYSDSITDQPMLQAVGRPFAVNPDRPLRSVALAQGWPIMDFGRPRAARRRLSGSGRRNAMIGALGVAAVTGLVWMRRGSGRQPSHADPGT